MCKLADKITHSLVHVFRCFDGREFTLQEDKWVFLVDGKSKGIPVSPFLDIPSVVIKDKVIVGWSLTSVPIHCIYITKQLCVLHMRLLMFCSQNEEGGMGVYFYDNASNGGDWVSMRVQHSISPLLMDSIYPWFF